MMEVLKPKFIGIGAMRSGTTSLFHCFSQHPAFSSPRYKEARFFDWEYQQGSEWYNLHFPVYHGLGEFTGEFTPGYFSHPYVPERVCKYLDENALQPRFILMLRNPVDRAFSHWCMLEAMNMEPEPFDRSVNGEFLRLNFKHRPYKDQAYHNYGYVYNGLYERHFKEWLKVFTLDCFLIIKSEDFLKNPTQTWKQVCDFLEVDHVKIKKVVKCNSYSHLQHDKYKDTFDQLKEYFSSHNLKLYELIGRDLGWQ